MRFVDYRVILNKGKFNWPTVAGQLDKTVEECFYQYSTYLGRTNERFKKEVLSNKR